jgi:hypothetical protein
MCREGRYARLPRAQHDVSWNLIATRYATDSLRPADMTMGGRVVNFLYLSLIGSTIK